MKRFIPGLTKERRKFKRYPMNVNVKVHIISKKEKV